MSQDSQAAASSGPEHTPPTAGFDSPRDRADARWRTDGTTATSPAPQSGLAMGGTVFAGVLMLCNGILGALMGISAIAKDDVYGTVGNYAYQINLTGWGWIHLILGVCVAATGAGLLKGAEWARWTGIFFAALGLIAQFMFLPYQPIWSVIMIAVYVFVIWALAAYRSPDGRAAA
ncbi:DUF7144 family membrane protein [Streptomyces boninensis]|uniref:DUF7144 family membrane protein n=1 Tax=Streptomyces boninensis TaxID=2039455 RepID=UPI003B2266F6